MRMRLTAMFWLLHVSTGFFESEALLRLSLCTQKKIELSKTDLPFATNILFNFWVCIGQIPYTTIKSVHSLGDLTVTGGRLQNCHIIHWKTNIGQPLVKNHDSTISTWPGRFYHQTFSPAESSRACCVKSVSLLGCGDAITILMNRQRFQASIWFKPIFQTWRQTQSTTASHRHKNNETEQIIMKNLVLAL